MLRSEESYLNELFIDIKKYAFQHVDAESFYNEINNLKLDSLQKIYSQKDFDFLKNVNDILSIVISIVTKPLLSVASNEIIVRSTQASNLSNDDFKKTMSDPSMWRHKDKEMIPSKVYYREYIDEIKIYENYFIVQLINNISKQLDLYSTFYSSTILKLTDYSDLLTEANTNQNKIISLANNINRKLSLIKSTHFYKTINKDRRVIQNIVPTNILLTNRLYNACFKFYKQLIAYGDSDSINNKLSLFYYCLIMKFLKKQKFELVGSFELNNNQKEYDFYKPLEFINKKTSILLHLNTSNIISFKYFIDELNESFNLALLISHDFEQIDPIQLNSKYNYDSFNFISIWDYGYIENNKKFVISANPIKEEEMIHLFFLDHYKKVEGSLQIYTKYCPICKKKDLFCLDDKHYKCNNCYSSFEIINPEANNNIIFTKIRRA